MVVQGDFEVKLVMPGEGNDEIPFKTTSFPEYTKDGQVYVEVEPDKEYLVAVRRVGKVCNKTLLYTIEVDGKCLGWKYRAHPLKGESDWTYSGQLERDEHGNRGDRILRFVTPRLLKASAVPGSSTSVDGSDLGAMMGEVKVKIYDAINYEKVVLTPPPASRIPIRMEPTPNELSSTSPKPPTSKTITDRDYFTTRKDIAKTKIVLSGLGSTFFSHVKFPSETITSSSSGGTPKTPHGTIRASGATITVSNIQKTYRRGHKVDIIVLKYATTSGLIKAGVFDPTSIKSTLYTNASDKNCHGVSVVPYHKKQFLLKQVKMEMRTPVKKEAKTEKSPNKVNKKSKLAYTQSFLNV
ncbi:hypothetical protein IV203_018142 [Nitzschia inconspicua]|uniref:Uncharacterized protein n=1 Tax=Nitzschia inconspicua TaxID=303405 RepID=A0A9K3Q8E0_9STRA|nr:hypothetical protein IV203_018142 [Nitzschia inconspicua]